MVMIRTREPASHFGMTGTSAVCVVTESFRWSSSTYSSSCSASLFWWHDNSFGFASTFLPECFFLFCFSALWMAWIKSWLRGAHENSDNIFPDRCLLVDILQCFSRFSLYLKEEKISMKNHLKMSRNCLWLVASVEMNFPFVCFILLTAMDSNCGWP